MIVLTVVIEGRTLGSHTFSGSDPIGIGRAEGNAVRIADGRISSRHGEVVTRDGRVLFRDLRSRNGSMRSRGGSRTVVDAACGFELPLESGDALLLGDVDSPVLVNVELRAPEAGDITIVVRRPPPADPMATIVKRSPGADAHKLLALLASLNGEAEAEAVFARVAGFLLDRLPLANRVTLAPVDRGEPALVLARGQLVPEAVDGGPPPYPVRLAEDVLQSGEAMLVRLEEPDPAARDRSLVRLAATTALAVPLSVGPERLGVLVVTGSGGFGDGDLELGVALAGTVARAFLTVRLVSRLRAFERRLRDENRYLRQEIERNAVFDTIIGSSPGIRAVFEQMQVVVSTDVSVLVLGETGTGKELVARAIHEKSPRKERLFAAVNCAAISETLLESELFGHVKGAFTGAVDHKKGLFQVADGGTLFLDEVGELSLKLQAKLLRALQEREVLPVGGTRPIPVDVRVVAATHRDLRAEAKAGRFREDLFYRLSVFPIRLPPLRERKDDVPQLAQVFIDRYATRFNKPVPGVTPDALAALVAFRWPGNIRQLENEIQRAVLVCPAGKPIGPYDLSEELTETPVTAPDEAGNEVLSPLKDAVERYEMDYIKRTLERYGWNRSEAARQLGISRQAFMVKLSKYGIAPE